MLLDTIAPTAELVSSEPVKATEQIATTESPAEDVTAAVESRDPTDTAASEEQPTAEESTDVTVTTVSVSPSDSKSITFEEELIPCDSIRVYAEDLSSSQRGQEDAASIDTEKPEDTPVEETMPAATSIGPDRRTRSTPSPQENAANPVNLKTEAIVTEDEKNEPTTTEEAVAPGEAITAPQLIEDAASETQGDLEVTAEESIKDESEAKKERPSRSQARLLSKRLSKAAVAGAKEVRSRSRSVSREGARLAVKGSKIAVKGATEGSKLAVKGAKEGSKIAVTGAKEGSRLARSASVRGIREVRSRSRSVSKVLRSKSKGTSFRIGRDLRAKKEESATAAVAVDAKSEIVVEKEESNEQVDESVEVEVPTAHAGDTTNEEQKAAPAFSFIKNISVPPKEQVVAVAETKEQGELGWEEVCEESKLSSDEVAETKEQEAAPTEDHSKASGGSPNVEHHQVDAPKSGKFSFMKNISARIARYSPVKAREEAPKEESAVVSKADSIPTVEIDSSAQAKEEAPKEDTAVVSNADSVPTVEIEKAPTDKIALKVPTDEIAKAPTAAVVDTEEADDSVNKEAPKEKIEDSTTERSSTEATADVAKDGFLEHVGQLCNISALSEQFLRKTEAYLGDFSTICGASGAAPTAAESEQQTEETPEPAVDETKVEEAPESPVDEIKVEDKPETPEPSAEPNEVVASSDDATPAVESTPPVELNASKDGSEAVSEEATPETAPKKKFGLTRFMRKGADKSP